MSRILPYGLGYRHSPPTLIERASSSLASLRVRQDAAPTQHPEFPGLFREWGALDQRRTSACTGFGVSLAARLQATVEGARIPQLSPYLPYWVARTRELGHDHVQDDGAYVPHVVWAMNTFGTCPDVDYPVEHINERPHARVFRAALHQRSRLKLRMSRIVDAGDRLLQRAAFALHSNQVCMVALPVGWEFVDAHGRDELPPTPTDGVLGWHFVVLLDWWPNNGSYSFLCANSWGKQWGDGGTAWLSAALVKQTQGIWVMDRATR